MLGVRCLMESDATKEVWGIPGLLPQVWVRSQKTDTCSYLGR